MKLNKKQIQKLNEKLSEVWPGTRQCPICHERAWNFSDIIFELKEYHRGYMVMGRVSAIIPLITATCEKCGYVILFNAVNLGLVEPPQKETPEGGNQ